MLPGFLAYKTTLMLYTNTGVDLDILIPIDLMWYQIITYSSKDFFSNVNSAPNVEVCTAVWHFNDHVVGVDTTTEKN